MRETLRAAPRRKIREENAMSAEESAPLGQSSAAGRNLTRSQLSILGFVASWQAAGGDALTKGEIARAVGRSVKTVDRAMALFRAEGIVDSAPRYDASGAQLGNAYRLKREPGQGSS